MPGGNPTTEVLGLTPRSPLTKVEPVLVTPVAASTEKRPALANGTSDDTRVTGSLGGLCSPRQFWPMTGVTV
jgi:hypothetical protein